MRVYHDCVITMAPLPGGHIRRVRGRHGGQGYGGDGQLGVPLLQPFTLFTQTTLASVAISDLHVHT